MEVVHELDEVGLITVGSGLGVGPELSPDISLEEIAKDIASLARRKFKLCVLTSFLHLSVGGLELEALVVHIDGLFVAAEAV